MNISRLSVNRPVTIIMIFLGIILLGLISWTKLPQELFPTIAYPQITVATSYLNAAPEEIESLVTKIIEEAVGTVKFTVALALRFVIVAELPEATANSPKPLETKSRSWAMTFS